MKTVEYAGPPLPMRAHPWTDATADATCRYYDLVATPALIHTALEDWLPWQHMAAVQRFYQLLEWLNRSDGAWQSNDCEFTAPHANPHAQIAAKMACTGRVMVLARSLAANLVPSTMQTLALQLHQALAPADATFKLGIISTALVPVQFVTLPGPPQAQQGTQLMMSFWAWGDDDAGCFANLDRLLRNLADALGKIAQVQYPLASARAAT
jgi:hypothetical protein